MYLSPDRSQYASLETMIGEIPSELFWSEVYLLLSIFKQRANNAIKEEEAGQDVEVAAEGSSQENQEMNKSPANSDSIEFEFSDIKILLDNINYHCKDVAHIVLRFLPQLEMGALDMNRDAFISAMARVEEELIKSPDNNQSMSNHNEKSLDNISIP